MTDIYDFFLHTLSVSFIAIFILILKRIFKRSLPPLWQFAMWLPCAVLFVIPINISSYLSLFTETVKTILGDTVSLTRPAFFFPLISLERPQDLSDILFFAYCAGVLILGIKYTVSSIRLRKMLKHCPEATEENRKAINDVCAKYSLTSCKAVTLNGIPAPFISGILKPILILPESRVDEKIILHELLHLKYKDVLWGAVIALFKCIHWCNPVLRYCLNEIGNDIEQLCDSRTLERLSGEDRREYGNLLLSLANDKYASLPGTTSIANGGKNIRRRIESIVSFKLFPTENAIISICIIALILSTLCLPQFSASIPDKLAKISDASELNVAFSAARSYYCTTPKGAIDVYAYSIYHNNGIYRAIASPLSEHNGIRNTVSESLREKNSSFYEDELDGSPLYSDEHYIYNLQKNDDGSYSALLVLLMYHHDSDNEFDKKIAYQKLRVYEEDSRWVVSPESDFEYLVTYEMGLPQYGCRYLPSYTYTAETELFTVKIHYQLCFFAEDLLNFSKPLLNATFNTVSVSSFTECIYKGEENAKTDIRQLGIAAQSFDGKKDFEITAKPTAGDFTSTSSDGRITASETLDYDWGNTVNLAQHGHTTNYKKNKSYLPEHIFASLYVNGELYEEIILEREK